MRAFQMIHPKEARVRRIIGGSIVAATCALFAVKGFTLMSAGAWSALLGAGIGTYRTGSLNQ